MSRPGLHIRAPRVVPTETKREILQENKSIFANCAAPSPNSLATLGLDRT